MLNPDKPLALSFPRRRESSGQTLREAGKTPVLSRYAGIVQPLGFPPARE